MRKAAIVAAIQLLAAAASAQASLLLTLDNPVQTGTPGSVVEFKGSITNTGPETLGLISVDFNPDVVPPPFETGIPIILLFLFKPAPGQVYTGTVFAVQIDPLASFGEVLQTVVTIADRGNLVQPSNGIPIRLTAVPEPSMLALTGPGTLPLLAAGLLRLRRQRQARSLRDAGPRLP